MDLFAQMDVYCERTDLSFWAEPLNAISNAAFIMAALGMVWRLRGSGLVGGYLLASILAAIGVGSFLFHTFATTWALLADVVPIGIFILVYLFLVTRDFLGMPVWGAALATAGYLPYAALVTPFFNALPFFEISNFYWTVPLLIFAVSFAVRRRSPITAQGMVLGAAVLCVSIAVRSLDITLCKTIPIGTHILWHIFNGVMLGWMIEVYRRHMVGNAPVTG